MPDQSMTIHLVAGGCAGTIGAVLTCPLEVVKTRLQSSSASYYTSKATATTSTHAAQANVGSSIASNASTSCNKSVNSFVLSQNTQNNVFKMGRPKLGIGIMLQIKHILSNEGMRGLFKGLFPTIFGVAPYRAIYFYSYAYSKRKLLWFFEEEKPVLHICSAFIAGFSAVTLTNPIWFVKTRLQLDHSKKGATALSVCKSILREKGPLGFYKGISASYFGCCETALYFMLYEHLKRLSIVNNRDNNTFMSYLTSAGFSKTLVSMLWYPHEVARTRLRQEGDKYHGLFQTFGLVFKEEGYRGLYKGMGTHLLRQIPNTAIVMTTYELIINFFFKCKTAED